jgi:hypothetical protein
MFHVSFRERVKIRDTVAVHRGNRKGANPLWARNACPLSVHCPDSRSKSEGSVEYGVQAGSLL